MDFEPNLIRRHGHKVPEMVLLQPNSCCLKRGVQPSARAELHSHPHDVATVLYILRRAFSVQGLEMLSYLFLNHFDVIKYRPFEKDLNFARSQSHLSPTNKNTSCISCSCNSFDKNEAMRVMLK
jgi:hypothetical protein